MPESDGPGGGRMSCAAGSTTPWPPPPQRHAADLDSVRVTRPGRPGTGVLPLLLALPGSVILAGARSTSRNRCWIHRSALSTRRTLARPWPTVTCSAVRRCVGPAPRQFACTSTSRTSPSRRSAGAAEQRSGAHGVVPPETAVWTLASGADPPPAHRRLNRYARFTTARRVGPYAAADVAFSGDRRRPAE